MFRFSGNEAGIGGLVTFKDSSWLLSIVIPHQPHFASQPPGVQVFWGYALFPDRVGDFVAKPMSDCTGTEILRELRGHLRFDPDTLTDANCIPCPLCRTSRACSCLIRRGTDPRLFHGGRRISHS